MTVGPWILFFFSFLGLWASVSIYVPSEDYPEELKLLLASVNLEAQQPEEKGELEKNLRTIESIHALLEKEELIFLTKSSIYKTLLSRRPSVPISERSFPGQKERDMVSNRFVDKPHLSWPLLGVIRDLEKSEAQSPHFDHYTGKIARQNLPPDFRPYERKVHLLLDWFYFFSQHTPMEVERELSALAHTTLGLLANQLHFFAFQVKGNVAEKPPVKGSGPLSSFHIRPRPLDPEPTEIPVPVEEIVEAVATKLDPANLPKPTNDWILPDTEFSSLPTPTNDWVLP